VIAGEDDAIIDPSESRALAAAIPGAELVIIPGAGHLVNVEQPEAFNSALAAWL
jgi:pimeloyl-ACP methyl ester carboxylesterase